jgi:OmpA-OmpF porin, OOP family
MKQKRMLTALLSLLIAVTTTAQIDVESKVKNKSLDRADQQTDAGIDKGLDKIEEGVGGLFKKKKSEQPQEAEDTDSEDQPENNANENTNTETDSNQPLQTQKLEAYTQYDFVAGDKVLYYEDFSQDAIGDFPALWTTNGSGEVKTLNIAAGKWFHMNGTDAVYCYTKTN